MPAATRKNVSLHACSLCSPLKVCLPFCSAVISRRRLVILGELVWLLIALRLCRPFRCGRFKEPSHNLRRHSEPNSFHASVAFMLSGFRKSLQDHFLSADPLLPSSLCRRLDFPSSGFSDTLPSSLSSLLRHNLRNWRVFRVWYTKIHHSEGCASLGVFRGL
jgi:hypothetical protein